MLNRPFSSINTNIFDETTHNSTPTTLCGQNVLVSQEQRQKVFNTSSTSIAGMPGYIGHYPPMQQNYPNSVTFTFNPTQTCLPQQNYCQCPPAMQSLNQLQHMNAIDLLALQRQLNEPYRCTFHLDNQTSTSDLMKANAKVEGNVYDDLQKEDEPKRVTFDLSTTKDADCQVHLGCSCCQNQNEDQQPTRSTKRRKKSRKKTGNGSDCSTTDDDDPDDDKR